MNNHRIAIAAGDGVGPEVVAQGRKALAAAMQRHGFTCDVLELDVGATHYLRTGEFISPDDLDRLTQCDALLVGAVGDPQVAPDLLASGLILRLRQELDLYANVRPVRLLPGATSAVTGIEPEDCDLVIVRESSEGLYSAIGGAQETGVGSIGIEVAVCSRSAVERILRHAFELSRRRDKHVTLVHKVNVLRFSGKIWMDAFERIGEQEFADVRRDYVNIDAMCYRMIRDPSQFDVVVTDVVFGDILTDVGAAIHGGLDKSISAHLDPHRSAPSLFEPMHGPCSDIAGRGTVDPVAAVMSVGMMLEFLGEAAASRDVDDAVHAHLVARAASGDRNWSTDEIGDHVASLITGEPSQRIA